MRCPEQDGGRGGGTYQVRGRWKEKSERWTTGWRVEGDENGLEKLNFTETTNTYLIGRRIGRGLVSVIWIGGKIYSLQKKCVVWHFPFPQCLALPRPC